MAETIVLKGAPVETAIAIASDDTVVLTVAGSQGASGGDGSTDIQKTAGEALGGHRAVVLNSSGQAIYADCSTPAHAHKVLGITTGAASSGAAVTIRTRGEITEGSWAWTLDLPIFLSTSGLLTQTPPTSGFVARIGFPMSATTIFIDIHQTIVR
jgi:hypothetical protein